MLHLHPDVVHIMIRDHMEQLRADREQWRDVRRAGVVRRAIGTLLIQLGERVGGQRVQPVLPPVTGKLATL